MLKLIYRIVMEDYNMNQDNSTNQVNHSSVRIVETGNSNIQNKCPKCGATEVVINKEHGGLICTFCRCKFQPEK